MSARGTRTFGFEDWFVLLLLVIIGILASVVVVVMS